MPVTPPEVTVSARYMIGFVFTVIILVIKRDLSFFFIFGPAQGCAIMSQTLMTRVNVFQVSRSFYAYVVPLVIGLRHTAVVVPPAFGTEMGGILRQVNFHPPFCTRGPVSCANKTTHTAILVFNHFIIDRGRAGGGMANNAHIDLHSS
ncbi:hypothetical protein D3C86_1802330 [compost metagenome]